MTRSLLPELMDSDTIPGPVLERVHRDLARVHSVLGTFATVERFLRADGTPPRKVLDIGCGDGALLSYLGKRMGVKGIGIDRKPGRGCGVEILAADAVRDRLPDADTAVCVLVAHHLNVEEIIRLIQNVGRSCTRFLIVDLVRHPVPLILFSIFICPWISRVAAIDGRHSVRRAYTPGEFREIVSTALGGTKATFSIDVSRFLSRQVIDIRY